MDAAEHSKMVAEAQQEFRRGTIILAVLSALQHGQHGYPLRMTLSDHGLPIDEGTLYPLLHRLETKGFLSGQWQEESGRKRRLYSLSPKGKAYRDMLVAEWKHTNKLLEGLL